MSQDFWIGVLSSVGILFIHWLTSSKEPMCTDPRAHNFDKWRISGSDAAQVKTCKVCGFSKKIPLD